MNTPARDYLLYRWRYPLGYIGIIAILSIVFTMSALYVPGSLREGELQSSLQSANLSLKSIEPAMVINLPYHALQRLSFATFGVTTLSIKLPSIILGVCTALGVFLLLRTWFRKNVAVLGTVLATTTTQFLYLTQDGTPDIMFSFTAIWLLFVATYVTRNKLFGTLWKVLAGVFVAVALYMPLGIYLVIAILTTALFHPHIRFIILRFSRPRLIIAIALGIITLAPVMYASIVDKTTLFTLLGLPLGKPDLWWNAKQLFTELFNFFSPSISHLLHPLYSLGVVLLMIIGFAKMFTVKYTARSYITLTWGVLMMPLILLNPDRVTYLFPLAVILMAMGMTTMITSWYKMFPRNPYARVAGLIPLTILVVGLVSSGIMRYVNNYQYNPDVLSWYSSDLKLLDTTLKKNKSTADSTRLIVSEDQQPFYAMVAKYDKRFTVGTDYESVPAVVMVTNKKFHTARPAANDFLQTIVTNRRLNNADRFYIYKK